MATGVIYSDFARASDKDSTKLLDNVNSFFKIEFLFSVFKERICCYFDCCIKIVDVFMPVIIKIQLMII